MHLAAAGLSFADVGLQTCLPGASCCQVAMRVSHRPNPARIRGDPNANPQLHLHPQTLAEGLHVRAYV
jgi:hypothetical protein